MTFRSLICWLGFHSEGPDSYSEWRNGKPYFVRICRHCRGLYHAAYWA